MKKTFCDRCGKEIDYWKICKRWDYEITDTKRKVDSARCFEGKVNLCINCSKDFEDIMEKFFIDTSIIHHVHFMHISLVD